MQQTATHGGVRPLVHGGTCSRHLQAFRLAVAMAPARRAMRLQRLTIYARAGSLSDYLSTARHTDDDAEFEARLAALRQAKGETPAGEGKKASRKAAAASAPRTPPPAYDFTAETLVFETGPATGDTAVNLALGVTLVWLPLTIAALGRAAFVKYRFTDQRLSCITTAPWKNEQLDAAYQEVKDVVSIGRGVGLWGDMVVTLRDGSKIELRALPRFKEMEELILRRRDELTGSSSATEAVASGGKGFA